MPFKGKYQDTSYHDALSTRGLPTSSVYPTKDEVGNFLTTEYGYCDFTETQVFLNYLQFLSNKKAMAIQEMPERAPAGLLPSSVFFIVFVYYYFLLGGGRIRVRSSGQLQTW